MTIRVLALDLERTLIDSAMSGTPRFGLNRFLAFCDNRFERVVVFTTVESDDARAVLTDLDSSGHMPAGFLARLEIVDWCGEYKDLSFIPKASPHEVLLVDDDAGWIRPDQRGQWIPISPWDGGTDDELSRVQEALESRLADIV